MISLAILLIIGTVGVWILSLSFKQLTAISVLYHLIDLPCKMSRVALCLTGFMIGSILVLLSIFIPAAFGIDMDMALFAFIIAMPYCTYQSLFATPLKLK